MRYEYECRNKPCWEKDENGKLKPFEFERDVPLSSRNIMPICEKCGDSADVERVIRTPYPVSQSWKTT